MTERTPRPESRGSTEAAPAATKDAASPKADITVDHELCKACGICISLCPTHVFDADDGGQAVAARPEDCTLCRLCEWHCPDFAIEVLARKTGDDEAAEAAPVATVPGEGA